MIKETSATRKERMDRPTGGRGFVAGQMSWKFVTKPTVSNYWRKQKERALV